MLQRISAAASLVVVLALAGTAFAGNGGNGAGANKSSSASISAPVVVGATGGTVASQPQFGDTITFNLTNQPGNAFVNLNCYQNGVNVASSWDAFWPTAGTFVLSSPAWAGGAANCTADLGTYTNSGTKFKVVASVSFNVVG